MNIVCLLVKALEMIIMFKKCSFKQHYEKVGTLSITDGYEKC